MAQQASVRGVFASCKGEIAAIVVLSFFINILMLTLPFYMLNIFSKVLSSRSEETLLMLTLAAFGALLTFGVLYAVRTKVLARFGAKFDFLLGERTLSALVSRALQANGRTGVQGMRDLNTVRGFVGGNEIASLLDAPWLPMYLVVIFLFHPWLGWTATAGAILLFVIAVLNEVLTRKPLGAAGQARMQAMNRSEAIVRNAGAIDAMGMLPSVLRRWRGEENAAVRLQMQATDRTGWLTGVSRFVRFFVQILMLAMGVYLVIQDQATPGIMIAAALLLGRALAPVESAIGSWRNLIGARTAAKRVDQLLENQPEPEAGMPLPAPQGRLAASGLVFGPAKSKRLVLRNVNFALEPGEAMGVVGPSAAGKSTLTKLMVGSWRPTGGSVRLDGADVAAWDPTDRGQYIGYLPQDVELLGDTVRENISRMRDDATSDKVIEAAQMAGVHDLILQLPDGYDTALGEDGVFLSPGQRQRIGLARALYDRPSLVVLDEPNASLDMEGEEALLAALRQLKEQGTTVVLVSHKPAILRHTDKILVLRQGQVQMFGERQEIMRRLTGAQQQGHPQVASQ